MLGGDKRESAEEAGYMELEGAEKSADCEKVNVKGGVSRDLGCCNYYCPVLGARLFNCGMCGHLIAKGGMGSKPLTGSCG
jgi:hypothetical protein